MHSLTTDFKTEFAAPNKLAEGDSILLADGRAVTVANTSPGVFENSTFIISRCGWQGNYLNSDVVKKIIEPVKQKACY